MLYCQRCGGVTEERSIDGRMRPVCLQCGSVTYLDPKLAVAVVIERDGQLLLGLRGSTTAAAGKWSFPAGFVERGERVEDAAVREIREEVGIELTLGPLLGLYSDEGEIVVLAVFPSVTFTGAPIAGDDLEAIGWFSPDDLPALAFPHDQRIVQDWWRWRRGPIQSQPAV